MSAQQLLLTALDQRYEKYRAERKRCKDEFSEEVVHDLRISVRRLLALIDLLRAIAPHSNLKKLRRVLKDQLDSLDDLRDVQVMLAEISEMLETLPEFLPLQKSLQKREKRLLTAAEIEVREFKSSAISRRIKNARTGLVELASQDLLAHLLAVVDDASLTVTQRKDRVDPAQSSTIHQVRVVFKKFRYMVEIICPILPVFPETKLKNMHDYQTAMGEIQDVEVLLQAIMDFTAKHKAYNFQPVRSFYEQRHSVLINAYIENMNEFVTFWREAPDKPFPWESQEKDKP